MALITPPSYQQQSTYTAQSDRQIQQASFNTTGVIGSGSMAVTAQASPNMTVNIADGWAAVVATTADLGVYTFYNDATVIQTISAANATNPRIDLIVATVNDAQYSGSVNNVVFTTVAGTPAASPTVPATPNNSIVLAQIAVAANATTITNSNITDRRLPVQSSALNYSYFVSNSNYTVASPTTSLQNIYAASGAGLTLAANTTYEIEGYFRYQFTIGATGLTTNFQLSYSSSQTSVNFLVNTGANVSGTQSPATTSFSFNTGINGGATTITNSTTNNTVYQNVYFKGIFRTLGSGVFNPQIGFSSVTNLTAVQGLSNSWMKATPIAGLGFTSLGAWS